MGPFRLVAASILLAACSYTHSKTAASSLSSESGEATLELNRSELALAVNDTATGAALTGLPRRIIVVNTGGAMAKNLTVSVSSLPSGTSFYDNCGSVLSAGNSCVVVVTPGASASSSCDAGTAPVPSVLTVSADGVSPVSADIYILAYGCVYQGGYVFSIDDTTTSTNSIGGKVAALTDQVAPHSGAVIWSANGHGHASLDVSYDLIPGINDASTPASASPSFGDFSTYLTTFYSSSPVGPMDLSACDGKADGACNTRNIVAFYEKWRTGYDVWGSPPFSPSVAVTPATDYAAGVCHAASDGGYADWYLPAICEMGFDNVAAGGAAVGCGSLGSSLVQNIEENLVLHHLGGFPYWYYWSSTEMSTANSAVYAWNQLMSTDPALTGSGGGDKSSNIQGVRCVRKF